MLSLSVFEVHFVAAEVVSCKHLFHGIDLFPIEYSNFYYHLIITLIIFDSLFKKTLATPPSTDMVWSVESFLRVFQALGPVIIYQTHRKFKKGYKGRMICKLGVVASVFLL